MINSSTPTPVANAGQRLAERLGLTITKTEGHDLVGPCPSPDCQSSDAWRLHVDRGVSQCYSCGSKWSPYALAELCLGNSRDAMELLIELGLMERQTNGHTTDTPFSDPITDIESAKNIPRGGLLLYGAKPTRSGAVEVPCYGPGGTQCTTFTLDREGKGRFAKGKPAGLYFPHENGAVRLPKRGETWLLTEGVKDAAAAAQLGYLAGGLNTCRLAPKFAPLFAGVSIILVPDRDRAGETGATESAQALLDIAAEIRIATLPAEMRDSNGADLRDILRIEDGEQLVRQAIDNAKWWPEPKLKIDLIDSATFAATQYDQRYLVHRLLVARQPAIIGGRSKTMKTSIAVDIALSLGSGTPCLNYFHAEHRTVALLSGESGEFTIQETANRIAAAKGIVLADTSVLWGFQLPQLARYGDLDGLALAIVDHDIDVLIIDPAYLCLLAGDTQGLRSSDVLSMGPLLLQLSELGQKTNSTIILAHHCRKNSPAESFSPPDLEELAMAGFGEWARQWLLLGRREAYEQGSGIHRLWLNVGGSAGHSGCYALNIDEGLLADDFTGRRWDVTISNATDARAESRRKKELERAQRQEEKEEGYKDRLRSVMQRFPAGETGRTLRETAGLSGTAFGVAIGFLLQEGRAEACQIKKGNRQFDGYKPTGK